MHLGTSFKYRPSGDLVEYEDTFQYVPLVENLEKFLNHSEVLSEVCN